MLDSIFYKLFSKQTNFKSKKKETELTINTAIELVLMSYFC